ncbi:MAG: ATP-binding protein [Candidatus Bathyarchaeota archaeon]|nr:ATP-binding protein [Candidatus Bathyarchaeota archaeon]
MSTKTAPQKGVFFCLYGPSKAGKTVASAAAGATGVFIGDPSGLLSAKTFLGIEKLNIMPGRIVPDITSAIEKITASTKKIPSIVVDDFSLIVETTINEYEKTKGRAGMWSALTRDVLAARDAARVATSQGIIVIFNCHEQPPRTSSGKFIRGGPSLPGQLPEKFSGMVDVIGRAMYEPTASPWRYQLCFEPQPDYVSGDRLSVFPGKSPMNIAEGLRAAGFSVPYPKGLDWIDSEAGKISSEILIKGIENWGEVLEAAVERLKMAGKETPHVRWALQDGLHRATIKHYQDIDALRMFTSSGEGDDLFA